MHPTSAPTHKTCTKCCTLKSIDKFAITRYTIKDRIKRNHNPTFRRNVCKDCGNQRRKCKAKGITEKCYKLMLEQQHNLCGICHLTLIDEPNISIDHSHITNEIRSIAHHYCNLVLGTVEGYPDLIIKCQEYLIKHMESK